MMKILFSYRFIFSIHLVMFMLFFCVDHSKAEEQYGEKVRFYWAFGAIRENEGDQKFIEITGDTELRSGDKLKMLMKLKEKCFVYVLYYSSQGELYMLFPYNLDQFSTDYKIFEKYYIPPGNLALELDENTGIEKFYLIASSKRFSELENLFSTSERSNIIKEPENIYNILLELKMLRKHHKKLKAEAERPDLTLGPIRAKQIDITTEIPDLDQVAIQFIGEKFFVKTFTIDHRN